MTTRHDRPPRRPRSRRSAQPVAATRVAFRSLLLRDLVVLRKTLKEFLPRTLLQPFLLVFVFTYVFPKIGQGVGGRARARREFSTLLVAGVVGLAIIFQGIQSVALPMVQEFGYTREIEDRVLAPMPVVARRDRRRRSAGALDGLFSRAPRVPDRGDRAGDAGAPRHQLAACCSRSRRSPATCAARSASRSARGSTPARCRCCSASSCSRSRSSARSTTRGTSLEPIPWLQMLVLANPLVYMCEGFRAALTNVEHMSLWAVYGALLAFSALFTWLGITGFKRRVSS